MSHINDLEEIRKGQILMAALKKISEMGIYNVTMDDIAHEAKLSKGGIAHYYPSKDILCKEAFKFFFDRIFQRSRDTMNMYDDPREQLLSFGWLYSWDDPDVNLGYPLLLDCMALASRDEDYHTIFHDWVNSWIDMLSEAVRAGQEKGIITGSDPDALARTISAIYHGIAVRWYLDKNGHPTQWAVDSSRDAITSLLEKDTTAA